MKRRIFKLVLVTCFILAVTALFTVNASAATYGDLTYTLSGGEVTITGCSTSATSVTIPSTINGNPVTSIGSFAFCECTSLTSVNIPDSVTSIGGFAFYYCQSLTSISIPDRVTNIGDYAFYKCRSLTSIDIPDSVTSIGWYAFENCTSLTSINIPDSVTSIGVEAFSGCRSLTSINIPDSVTSIGSSAFYECTSLKSVSIPDSVTSIGEYAFDCCTSLVYNTYDNGCYIGNSSNPYLVLVEAASENITLCDINKNTRFIHSGAFYNCTSLTSINIPDSVTSIGGSTFYGCTSLTSIDIPDSVTSIGGSTFYGCTSLTSVSIGNSVTSIGDDAFRECTSLTSVSIGNSVTSIGGSAFAYCRSLTSISIPDSVTSIGDDAFRECTSLESVSIGKGVTIIGNYAFYYCTSLNTVYYCGTDVEWNNISIGSYNTYLTGATRYYHTPTITAPTCTENGTKITKCDICGIESTEIIPALGHSWSDWGEKIAPTCSVAGFERRTCSACDSQENRIVAPRHTWGEWDVLAEPTCTDDGSRSRNCQSCGATETEELSPLGHDEVKHAAQAPTCTSVGWSEYTACTRCGQNNCVEIPALGHSWEGWHTVIFPTADSVGFKERCCSACSDEEYDYVYFASGDVDGDGTLTNADLTLAVRAISGWNIEGNVALIDINYDGKYNNRDIIAFIQKLAEQEPVYRVDPSNLKNRTYVFCKSNITAKPEISCVSLHFEDEFSFDIYMTCVSTCGSGEVCFTEERFTYNGIDFHPIGYGGEGGIDAKVSGNYIVVNAFGNILTLEVLSNDTLRAIAPSDFYSVSAGDIFR